MYHSIPSFISYAQTRAQILSQTELEQTFCYLQVRKYRSLTKRLLPKSHADQLTFASYEEMLIGLEFKSTRTIRQQHSHTDIICLRGGSKVVLACARIGVPTLPPRGRGRGFAPRFPAIPLPRFAFPPSSRTHCASFRGECVIYARRIIRGAGDKSFIAAESRHGTRLLLPSYSLLAPNRTRLHDE